MFLFLKAWWGNFARREVFVLWRWNTVTGADGPIMSQLTLLGLLGWQVRLHFFYRADGEDFHSHPRGFISVCLCGVYQEVLQTPHRVRVVQRGTLTLRKATDVHNVTPIALPCVTFVVTTPVLRKWEKFPATQHAKKSGGVK